jgi:hypothetical protein
MVAEHLTKLSTQLRCPVQRKYTPVSVKHKVTYILTQNARVRRDTKATVSAVKSRKAAREPKKWMLGGDESLNSSEFDAMITAQRILGTQDDDSTEPLIVRLPSPLMEDRVVARQQYMSNRPASPAVIALPKNAMFQKPELQRPSLCV